MVKKRINMDETILLDYLRGNCNQEEGDHVEAWCEESPENRKMLEQLYRTLFIGDRVAVMQRVDTEELLNEFKLSVQEEERKAMRRRRAADWKRWAVVAAAFLCGLIFTGVISWGLLSREGSDYTMMTSAGQRAQAILPDGSKVWLNASTQLTYRNSFFGSERLVDLSGEAYFEVSPDNKASFVVNSQQVKTSVLGTKFNLRAREKESKVVATLFEGAVRVESPQAMENAYLLKPGQTLQVNTDTYQAELIEYAQPEDVLLWVDGKLVFREQSLWEITRIMEKLYDVAFIFEDETLKSEHFTGKFSTDNTATEILNVLTYTNHFIYQQEGKVIRLSEK